MARGRPRKPDALKEITGTAQPCRMNPAAPDPGSDIASKQTPAVPKSQKLTGAPKDFDQFWRPLLVANGIIKDSDLPMWMIVCYLFAQVFDEMNNGEVDLKKVTELRQLAGHFGLTPSTRGSLAAGKKSSTDNEDNDPWDMVKVIDHQK